jgi:serine/threonine protein kinase
MHKRNIAHRDIKPENILMESKDTSNLNLKITDFGFAKSFDPNEGGLTETLGSPLYMAPEIIKKLPYNCAVDIWALGVLSYIMLSGKPPFKGRSKDEIFV